MSKIERKSLTLTDGGLYFSSPNTSVQFIHSGSKLLDLVLGGGWAERRISNIVGNASTGKTLLTIEACANFNMKYPKGKIIHRETEEAWDDAYAQALGMPVDQVDRGRLDTVEDFFEDVEAITKTKTKQPIFYVLDTLDAMSSRAELARKIDESSYGTERAKSMSQMFRRRVPAAMNSSNMTMMIVSQVRQNIGVLIGRKWIVAGGEALGFYASQRIKLNQIKELEKTVKGIKRTEGILVKADCFKNKVGLPYRDCTFSIRFGFGIDDVQECLEFLHAAGFLSDPGWNSKDAIKERVIKIIKMSDADRKAEVKRIYAATEKCWYEVEKQFLSTQRKY